MYQIIPNERVRKYLLTEIVNSIKVPNWNSSQQLVFLAVTWMVIGSVSAYDTYLTIQYQDSIKLMEQNPVGRWLIRVDSGSVALFVGAKFAGTILVLGAIPLLYLRQRSLGVTVASGVAVCQVILLCYLTIA